MSIEAMLPDGSDLGDVRTSDGTSWDGSIGVEAGDTLVVRMMDDEAAEAGVVLVEVEPECTAD